MKIVNIIRPPNAPKLLRDQELFDQQMAIRANYLLLGDTEVAQIPHNKIKLSNRKPIIDAGFKWVDRGEIVAGSWVAQAFGYDIGASDADIYFKSEVDANEFCKKNKFFPSNTNKVSHTVDTYGCPRLNLIFGVHFDSPEELIYRFDIRACSIAIDPNDNTAHWITGSTEDCGLKQIVYNPLPHNTSLARLVKYTQKGFSIDAHQRLFLLELIKSGQVDPAIELTSGYRAVQKV